MEFQALHSLLSPWMEDAAFDDMIGDLTEYVRCGVDFADIRKSLLEPIPKESTFIRQRAESLLDNLTSVLPQYTRKGYSKKEMERMTRK